MKYGELKRKNEEEILKLQEYDCGEGGMLPLLYFPLLDETGIVKNAFTTREGGVSKGIFESLNLSFTRGDDPDAVKENYRRIAAAFGKEVTDIVCSDQTHTTNVVCVDGSCGGYGITRERPYTDVDGLVTDEPGLILATFYADCVPLYFVDPVHRAIGLSHSGWRGTVGKMGKVTVEKLVKEFGSDPKDILAAIGPSICQDCYEVSEDVIERFKEAFDASLWEELFYKKENGKYQLNLWHANEAVFEEAGILKEHMAVTNLCTHCNPDLLFSHRTTGNARGNLSAFLALQEV